jgi:hypothetical protein
MGLLEHRARTVIKERRCEAGTRGCRIAQLCMSLHVSHSLFVHDLPHGRCLDRGRAVREVMTGGLSMRTTRKTTRSGHDKTPTRKTKTARPGTALEGAR